MSVNRILPSAPIAADGTAGVLPSRTDPYGGAFVNGINTADQGGFAEEGSAFAVMNATAGTAVTGNAAPVAATSLLPFFHIFNSGTKTIQPRFAWIRTGTAPSAGATTTELLMWSDTSPATTWSSGGVIATQVNLNTGQTGVGGAICRIGALVIIAVAARKLWQVQTKTTIGVIQDTYNVTFGAPSVGIPTAFTPSTATVTAQHVAFPAVAIAPLTNWSFSIDGLSQSGAGAYEFSLFYTER